MQERRRCTTPWRATTIGVLAAILAAGAADAQAVKVEGRILDAQGAPAAGAEVAPFWNVDEKTGEQRALQGVAADADGRFTLKVEAYGRDPVLVAFDKDRKNAAMIVVPKDATDKPAEMRLAPAVRIHGKLDSKELGRVPGWMNIYLYTNSKKGRPFQRHTMTSEFSLLVPAGEYDLNAYGGDVRGVTKPLTLSPDQPDVDLGTIDLPAQALALFKGKPMPAWKIADARGAKKDVTIADYRGKWVLIAIWGYWCGPCVRELAELIDLYDEHAADRDKFEIIAFHDGSVKDFSEMDAKTEGTKKSIWRGRDLPFPVLLDAPNDERGATVKELQIQAFPTSLLIDPEGILVGQVSPKALEDKLPPIPMAARIPRALDRYVAIGFSPMPLDRALKFLSDVGGVPIKADEPALESAGIKADDKTTLKASAGLSLRSWLGLTLDPLGLDVKPADDGLHVVKAAGPREQSPLQRQANKAIEEKLATPGTFSFQDVELEDLLAGLEGQTQETFILDPVALKAGRIDPLAKVSGKAQDAPLRGALDDMLRPLGLKSVVRDEAVILTVEWVADGAATPPGFAGEPGPAAARRVMSLTPRPDRAIIIPITVEGRRPGPRGPERRRDKEAMAMQTRRRRMTPCWIGVLAAILAADSANAQAVKIEGRVLDAEGKPAAGIEVASFWDVDEKTGEQKPDGGAVTDAEGRFTLNEETYGRDPVLVAFDKDRKNAAMAVVSRSAVGKTAEMRLAPAVRIHGKLQSAELHRSPKWMNIYMYTADKKGRPIQRVTTSPEFSMVVPAGEYEMEVSGAEVRDVARTLKLKPDHPVQDLGTIDLPAQAVALLKGKPMPAWKIADARGVKKDATIADYRGKWVLVDVWAHWSGPSVRQLNELIDFYEQHAAARDKFEIIAFHDGTVRDLAELDARTAVTRQSVWRGRDLPFPVLVDASNNERGATIKELQIQAFPTMLLVDPRGALVGEVELKELEKKLPPLSLGDRVPQALDGYVAIAFHPMSLNKSLEFLSKMGGVPIKLDEGTLQSAGIHPDVVVPLKAGAGLSLRSWLGLMLDPLGLDVKPADDGLHVVKAAGPREQSPHQREVNKGIEEKLSKLASFTFEEAELENLLAGLEEQIGETFILDPVAVQAGRIDPHAKVSGKPRNVPIRKALETMLHPLGVKIVIRDEAVILTK